MIHFHDFREEKVYPLPKLKVSGPQGRPKSQVSPLNVTPLVALGRGQGSWGPQAPLVDSGGSVVVHVCTLEAGLVARVGEAPAQSSSEGPNALIGSLRQLMAWKQEGLLSDVEFANAKQQLGL